MGSGNSNLKNRRTDTVRHCLISKMLNLDLTDIKNDVIETLNINRTKKFQC